MSIEVRQGNGGLENFDANNIGHGSIGPNSISSNGTIKPGNARLSPTQLNDVNALDGMKNKDPNRSKPIVIELSCASAKDIHSGISNERMRPTIAIQPLLINSGTEEEPKWDYGSGYRYTIEIPFADNGTTNENLKLTYDMPFQDDLSIDQNEAVAKALMLALAENVEKMLKKKGKRPFPHLQAGANPDQQYKKLATDLVSVIGMEELSETIQNSTGNSTSGNHKLGICVSQRGGICILKNGEEVLNRKGLARRIFAIKAQKNPNFRIKKTHVLLVDHKGKYIAYKARTAVSPEVHFNIDDPKEDVGHTKAKINKEMQAKFKYLKELQEEKEDKAAEAAKSQHDKNKITGTVIEDDRKNSSLNQNMHNFGHRGYSRRNENDTP